MYYKLNSNWPMNIRPQNITHFQSNVLPLYVIHERDAKIWEELRRRFPRVLFGPIPLPTNQKSANPIRVYLIVKDLLDIVGVLGTVIRLGGRFTFGRPKEGGRPIEDVFQKLFTCSK